MSEAGQQLESYCRTIETKSLRPATRSSYWSRPTWALDSPSQRSEFLLCSLQWVCRSAARVRQAVNALPEASPVLHPLLSSSPVRVVRRARGDPAGVAIGGSPFPLLRALQSADLRSHSSARCKRASSASATVSGEQPNLVCPASGERVSDLARKIAF